MKKCKGCGQEKPLSDFYKHPATADGYATKCKECAKAIVKAAREKNKDHYREFDRARAMRPDRVKARKEYQSTEAGRAAVSRARAAYKARAPERRAAQTAVGNAVRDGRLKPWPVCAMPDCECASNLEAHHPDYSRPLDVVWLCNKHHRAAHAMVES